MSFQGRIQCLFCDLFSIVTCFLAIWTCDFSFEPVPSSDQRCKLGNSKRKRVTDFRNQFPAAHLSWGYVTARPVVRHDFFSFSMFVRSEPSFTSVSFKKWFQKHMNVWSSCRCSVLVLHCQAWDCQLLFKVSLFSFHSFIIEIYS